MLERLPGLAGDQRFREAAARGRAGLGRGAGASPLVSGHMAIPPRARTTARRPEGQRGVRLSARGFLANTGVIAALAMDGVVAT